MKICRECGQEVPDDSSFCVNCGQKVADDSRYCLNCGQIIPDDSRFCVKCGTPVTGELPNSDVGVPQSNWQGNPDHGMRVAPPEIFISTNQINPKKSNKAWGWIIVIALIVLSFISVAVIGSNYLGLRDQAKALITRVIKGQPGTTEIPIITPITEAEIAIVPQAVTPEMAVVPQVETPEMAVLPQVETRETQKGVWTDTILAVTNSGVWAVNEKTQETVKLTNDQVDSPWDLNDGLSVDKKYFAYLTGLGGDPMNPKLVVLDIENQKSILQLKLTGPIIQAGMEGSVGDPAFEAFRAMQFDGSIAWSPDGNQLAFVAARDGNSTDAYLFNIVDNLVTRLSEEDGHAYGLHWSPDGRFLEFLSAFSFGTGGGSIMESLWAYDFQEKMPQFMEYLTSSGENFLGWADNSHFLIASQDAICENYNLRLVNAARSFNEVIVDGCFSDIAYNPEQKQGMFAVSDWNYENCSCGEALDPGLMIFGEEIGYPVAGEIGYKKFEQLDAYTVSFIPQGNLFIIYSYDEEQFVFDSKFYTMEIPKDVQKFTPHASPNGDFWAWSTRWEKGLWVTTKQNLVPVEVSPLFSGVPLWSEDGKTIYFFEKGLLFSASTPQFKADLLVELPGVEILGLIK